MTQDVGPVIWTGGSFGPEGGLSVFIAILLGLVLVSGWLRVRAQMPRLELSLADAPRRENSQE